jgi:hypothetical protein
VVLASCRLFVIPARDRPRAVILRRGPSAWAHVIVWDTDRDNFDHGAWFRGRIYEDRCDVSPDGELFLYFALQGSRWKTSYRGSWTAVSRPPWLHALTLWPQGDTWGGGGRFVSNRKVELQGSRLVTHPDHPVVGLEAAAGAAGRQRSQENVEDSDWAGRDHAGALIYTRAGKLFRRRKLADVELADFGGLTPDPQPPPSWAIRPLPPLKRRPRR